MRQQELEKAYADHVASLSAAQPRSTGPLYGAGQASEAAPLTQAVMHATEEAMEAARNIRSLLWQIRDRVLGPVPTNGVQGDPSEVPTPSNFADAFGNAASDLREVLSEACAIAVVLNSRI